MSKAITGQTDLDRRRNHILREYVPYVKLTLGAVFAAAACVADGGVQITSAVLSLVSFGAAARSVREDLPYILPAIRDYRDERRKLGLQ